MTHRERFHAVMQGKPVDRLPIVEWATWWTKTIDRWRGEGLPSDWRTNEQITNGFQLDPYRQWWISPRRTTYPASPGEGLGCVSTEADYEAIRPHLYPDLHEFPEQLARWRNWAEQQRRGEAVLWITLEGFFWYPRVLLGIENHLLSFYDMPGLLHRMNSDLSAWHRRVVEQMSEIGSPDFMTFAEDMSYNHGPMLSEAQFDEFLLPYYRSVIPQLKSAGTAVLVDSDGDVTIPARWFERAGIDGILPLERQAGVDVEILQRSHPTMCFIGHFNKLVMSKGEAAMRKEFDRLLPLARKGRFIISCDHQTPPEVSLEQYQAYLKLFREYAQRV